MYRDHKDRAAQVQRDSAFSVMMRMLMSVLMPMPMMMTIMCSSTLIMPLLLQFLRFLLLNLRIDSRAFAGLVSVHDGLRL